VATAALVRSMQWLHQRGMVVRRVATAEALGGVTVICTDKTGTPHVTHRGTPPV
jgi:P-type Ca2+ transporter type 2C